MSKGPRVSLLVYGMPFDWYPRLAARAEEVGCEAVWLADHLISPTRTESVYPYDPSGSMGFGPDHPIADMWVTLGAMAMVTTRLLVGSGVYILPLREPIATARAAGTVHTLSNGRLLFGVGTGWQREEFDAVGFPFEGRGARTTAIIGLLRELWSGAPVQLPGAEVQFAPALDPPPPILVGGLAPAARERAAHADGWFGPRCELETAVAVRQDIERRRVDAGLTGPYAYWIRVFETLSRERVGHCHDEGFEHLVVTLPAASGLEPTASFEDHLKALERVPELTGVGAS